MQTNIEKYANNYRILYIIRRTYLCHLSIAFYVRFTFYEKGLKSSLESVHIIHGSEEYKIKMIFFLICKDLSPFFNINFAPAMFICDHISKLRSPESACRDECWSKQFLHQKNWKLINTAPSLQSGFHSFVY